MVHFEEIQCNLNEDEVTVISDHCDTSWWHIAVKTSSNTVCILWAMDKKLHAV